MTGERKQGFKSVSLPVELVDKIDRLTKDSDVYHKRPDVIKHALSLFFEKQGI
jgi:Arc/MetJ-type ribon-helix-helix transcriptional regulator